jgi:hypothetical protein
MDRRYAKVMVEIEMDSGLPAEVEVVWGHRSWKQILDFFIIPFRCFACKEIGHIHAKCPNVKKSGSTMDYFCHKMMKLKDEVIEWIKVRKKFDAA